ncbi:phage late control D family protein [Polyangium mundeleinium]|uniref:Contractile injection system protein, VgrG/Pvc8 family n=1 Tax=Polyangium mundeleinium TaxID=2995306 RepID=A0ABT5F1A0_9BACT|nr:contractile injection system protein, VgrG/Pvc8 family [Polyangium mundeleinium]MDC0747861.1 contractile injection system protein, VgrG/Pvc8 family [Polyangium mundeleinium]
MAETNLTEEDINRVRPTVRVSGKASDGVTRLLSSMRMEESEGGMSSLELRLLNAARFEDGEVELAFEDEATIRHGVEIAVYAGDELGPQEIFRGLVTGLEGTFEVGVAPELFVLAEDALQRARLSRRTRVIEDARIDSIAKELASRIGLDPVVKGFTESLGTQVQLDETDLAFLRRMLAARDGDVQVVGKELHVSPRKDVRRGVLELMLGRALRRARVTADLAHQVTEVTVGGWDAVAGRRVEGSGTGTNLGPGAGRRGSALLEAAVGARIEHLRDVPATTDDEARAIAEASFDRRARRFVCVDATAEGNPALRVGTHVRLIGLGPRFDNTYVVVRAQHRFDVERGYEIDFEAECAFLGGP